MPIKAVLFDLDGTLLPMDQDEFTKAYFKQLAVKAAPHGYETQKLISSIWAGTAAMVKNDGTKSNEEAFWETFAQIYGEEALKDKAMFDEFYRNEFQSARASCGFNPLAEKCVKRVKELGFRTVLATNPIFPAVATESRIRWAGLSTDDFELYTTYENIGFCKPNTMYFTEILNRIGLNADECLMVGNDVTEDMVAKTIGMNVFLLIDCIINKNNEDISAYPHGGFEELISHIETLAGKE